MFSATADPGKLMFLQATEGSVDIITGDYLAGKRIGRDDVVKY